MLKLSKEQPAAQRVDLGGGAHAMIRPATSLDVDRARLKIERTLYDVRRGQDTHNAMLSLFGMETVDEADDVTLEALARKMATLELALLCLESWEGVGNSEGVPAEVNFENLAILLRDHGIYTRIWVALNEQVHRVYEEGNASSASLNGAGQAEEATAPTAES